MKTPIHLLICRAARLCAWLALTVALSSLSRAAANDGVLTGSVSNTATGNLLEGAKVELPQLGQSALVDNTGRYVLAGVPAGTHEVIV